MLAFYLFLLLRARDPRTWVPIKDGQVCFFCTTTSAVAIRDLAPLSPQGNWGIIGPIVPLVLSLIVYCAAVFTALNPETHADTARKIDARISVASILCVVSTILIIGGLRYSYGLFDAK